MDEGEEDGEVVLFRVVEGGGAVYPEADAVVGLGEGFEEVEDGAAFPGVEVDLLPGGAGEIRHAGMLSRGSSWALQPTLAGDFSDGRI